jgi:hypothetical protein
LFILYDDSDDDDEKAHFDIILSGREKRSIIMRNEGRVMCE